jgi:hypothetical protein
MLEEEQTLPLAVLLASEPRNLEVPSSISVPMPPVPQRNESGCSPDERNKSVGWGPEGRTHVRRRTPDLQVHLASTASTATQGIPPHNTRQAACDTVTPTDFLADEISRSGARHLPPIPPVVFQTESPSPLSFDPIFSHQQTPSSSRGISLSTRLIRNHLAAMFVKFTLIVNDRSIHGAIQLGDCCNADVLHQAVNDPFKDKLMNQIPSELVFTFGCEEYTINADEGGQMLLDELIEKISNHASASIYPAVATVKM